MAIPSSRIIRLAKPKAPATLLEEWDPVPKPKPHVSDYNRLLHLASKWVPGGARCLMKHPSTLDAVGSSRSTWSWFYKIRVPLTPTNLQTHCLNPCGQFILHLLAFPGGWQRVSLPLGWRLWA